MDNGKMANFFHRSQKKFGSQTHEATSPMKNAKYGISGLSALMFLERRHILAGLQCAEWLEIDMQLSIANEYSAHD